MYCTKPIGILSETYDVAFASLNNLIKQFCDTEDRAPQLLELVHYLSHHTGWLTDPASCHHHNAFPGGLLIHSVTVANVALQLKPILLPDYPTASVTLVALFHDVGKVGLCLKETCIPRYWEGVSPTERTAQAMAHRNQPRGLPSYRYNNALMTMPLAVNSLTIVNRFLDLYPDEAQAILAHDGQYCVENRHVAHKEQPLTVLLHFADYFSGHVIEGNLDPLAHHKSLMAGRSNAQGSTRPGAILSTIDGTDY